MLDDKRIKIFETLETNEKVYFHLNLLVVYLHINASLRKRGFLQTTFVCFPISFVTVIRERKLHYGILLPKSYRNECFPT